MKVSSILPLVGRVLLAISAVLLIWRPLVIIAHGLAQGQDRRYEMGDNYEIWCPTPSLVRLGEGTIDRIIYPERILEFAVTAEWIIGKTETGWFAVNKKTHEVHYPCSSQGDVQSITGVDVSMSPATWDHLWPYAMPCAKKAEARANRVCWVLVFAVPALVGFGPPLLRMVSRKRGKLPEGGEGDAARV